MIIATLFSDWCCRNLEGYIYIDSDVSSNRYSNSLPGVEDDADIRGNNVLFVFCLPRTSHHTRIFEQPLFWIANSLVALLGVDTLVYEMLLTER